MKPDTLNSADIKFRLAKLSKMLEGMEVDAKIQQRKIVAVKEDVQLLRLILTKGV